MNVLALDFGLKRIGVSVGSTESGIAFPRDVLVNDSDHLKKLQGIVQQENIQKILVGMPLKRDGAAGDIDPELQVFLKSLQEFGLPVELMDERYTSKIAQAKLSDIGMKAKEQRSVSDSTAAQLMLQEWLELSSGH